MYKKYFVGFFLVKGHIETQTYKFKLLFPVMFVILGVNLIPDSVGIL